MTSFRLASPPSRPTRRPHRPRLEASPPQSRPSHCANASVPLSDHPAFAALLAPIRRAVADAGYPRPTPIQATAIPLVLAGRDLLGCAQTGTGKTAAFTLPMLDHLGRHPRKPVRGRPRVLVLAPTRELAAQIGESIRVYGRHLRIAHTVVFGGVGQRPQAQALTRGVDVVVATPGRLLDLMQQRLVRLDDVEFFVLDEADRMLDMGFIPDIRKVIAALPEKRQSLFFSATLQPKIMELAETMVCNPAHVTITPEAPAVEKISQKVLFVDKQNKDALLAHLLKNRAMDRVIIFTQMKHAANKVCEKLVRVGIAASAIHGNKSQRARTMALADFKKGAVRVLVATDIAARGLDVDGITHVINYHLPLEPETYIHRIGRTARAGADGDAISLCHADERNTLLAIERILRKPIPVDAQHPYHSDTAAVPRQRRRNPHAGGGSRRPVKSEFARAFRGRAR